MPWFDSPAPAVVRELNTSAERGLSGDEARRRLVEHGPNALEEAHKPISTATRGILSEASPGYFGFSLPVGKMVAVKPQGRFALIKQSSLQAGYLYPGVVHDGLLAFWTPSKHTKSLKLLIAKIKTKFTPNDEPQRSTDFSFSFQAVHVPITKKKK